MSNKLANHESVLTTYYWRVFFILARIFFNRRWQMENQTNTSEDLYTCKKCGCHEFIVEHLYTQNILIEDLLRCSCEDSDEEYAAVFQNRLIKEMRSWGFLDEDHRVGEWDKEEVDNSTEQDDNPKINCLKCYEVESDGDWEPGEEFEPEIFDEEWFVRCSECNREIEFGWSHPIRGGGIWTAEDRDFDPWQCCPEERYIEKWRKKGWIRPPKQN